MQSLYRFFAKDSTLLYVGVSINALDRLESHRAEQKWFHEIATITIEKFVTRNQVLKAERIAILKEHPKYNIVYNNKAARIKLAKIKKDELAPSEYRRILKSLKFSRLSSHEEHELHTLDYAFIRQYGTTNESFQLCLVWCRAHETCEWQWLDINELKRRGVDEDSYLTKG